MTEGAQKRLGFSAIGGRKAKAENILDILDAAGRPLKPIDRVLDVGCGSGEIAAALAEVARVECVDVIEQRIAGRRLPFDYLPWRPSNRLAGWLGRLDEPLRLVSLPVLRGMAANRSRIEVWHPRLLQRPGRFALRPPTPLAWLLRRA